MDNEIRMPFTNETPEDLSSTLNFINTCGLSIESFDCFLYNYKLTGDIDGSITFAASEWDL